MARAFALYAALAARHGCEIAGPSYVANAMSKAKRKVEEQWEKEKGKF